MEMVLSNGFCELQDNVNGGSVIDLAWYDHLINIVVPGYTTVKATYQVGKHLYDLGYENGFNSTK